MIPFKSSIDVWEMVKVSENPYQQMKEITVKLVNYLQDNHYFIMPMKNPSDNQIYSYAVTDDDVRIIMHIKPLEYLSKTRYDWDPVTIDIQFESIRPNIGPIKQTIENIIKRSI